MMWLCCHVPRNRCQPQPEHPSDACWFHADEVAEKAEVKIDPRFAMKAVTGGSARVDSGAGASSSAAGPSAKMNGTAARGSGDVAYDSQLWVEKHKPQDSRELVGNQATIEWLRVFLRNWCAALMLWLACAPHSHKALGSSQPARKEAEVLL